MAYDLFDERIIADSQSGTATAVIGQHPITSVPTIVRSLHVAVKATGGTLSGSCVVAFKRRPTYGSATGEVTIGSVTIPAAQAAAGKVFYKEGFNTKVNPGEAITAEVTTAMGGSTPTLTITAAVNIELSPDVPDNFSRMIKSA